MALRTRALEQRVQQLRPDALPAGVRHDGDRELGRPLVDEAVAPTVPGEQAVPGGTDRKAAVDGDHRAEIEDELRFHLEMEMAPGRDRRGARLRLGNVTTIAEDTRAVGVVLWLESVLQDARYGLRQLYRTPGLASAVVLAGFRWWAPIVLAGAWLATHWLLRESAVWRDRNTEEVRGAQRDSDYAYRLAVDPPAAKELRLFGLAGWVIERFSARRVRLHELQYRATKLREKSVLGCLAIVLPANLLVFWALADAALQATLIGRPVEGPALQARPADGAPRADAH